MLHKSVSSSTKRAPMSSLIAFFCLFGAVSFYITSITTSLSSIRQKTLPTAQLVSLDYYPEVMPTLSVTSHYSNAFSTILNRSTPLLKQISYTDDNNYYPKFKKTLFLFPGRNFGSKELNKVSMNSKSTNNFYKHKIYIGLFSRFFMFDPLSTLYLMTLDLIYAKLYKKIACGLTWV
jgi:hypothetical protein